MTELALIDSVEVKKSEKRVMVRVFLGPGREGRFLPFLSPMQGLWVVPERGQLVEVYQVAPGRWAARFPHTVPDYDMPAGLSEGDYALTLNADTAFLFKKQSDDTYNIELKADGDIDMSATGNITIDGIDIDSHTHDYEDELSDGTTSTKTTQGPN